MGTSINAYLVVGLPFDELPEVVQEALRDDPDAYYDDLRLFSPYYDASTPESLLGVSITGSWGWTEVTNDHIHSTEAAYKMFVSIIGVEPKLYVTTHIY